jgi:outer membrane protein, heavy metal efflux system
MSLRGIAFLICLPYYMTGCAVQSRQSVQSDVQDLVYQRTGYSAEYSLNEQAVSNMIDSYLEDELTIDETVKIALLNNQGLQAAYEKLGIARGELIDAGLLRNPIFEAEVHFEGGGIGTGTNLNLVQEFISIFQLPLRKRVAESALEAAKHEVAMEVMNLIYDTKGAFYSVQGANQLYDLRKQVMQVFEASAEITKRAERAGNVTPLRVASETVLYAKSRRDFARAQAELFDQREKLNLLLGLWGRHTDWTVSSQLPEPPEENVNEPQLESLGVSRRPELAQARFEIEALANQYGITQAYGLIPEFNLGVDVEGEDGSKTVVGPNFSLPLPIFNQGQGLVVQAEARLKQAQRKYIAEAVKVRSEVRRALNRFILLREQVVFDRRHLLPLTNQVVRNAQLEYNAMLVGVFDLLRAKQEEIETVQVYVEALRDYWVARTELERATGGDFTAALPADGIASKDSNNQIE